MAQAITDAGLADYYRYRTAVAVPQLDQHDVPVPAALQLFDLAEVQQTFVRAAHDGAKEAALMLENITCAACVWLIEKRIGSLPGVRSVEINHATRRARVTWDDAAHSPFRDPAGRLPTSVTARNRTTLRVPTRSTAPSVGELYYVCSSPDSDRCR